MKSTLKFGTKKTNELFTFVWKNNTFYLKILKQIWLGWDDGPHKEHSLPAANSI